MENLVLRVIRVDQRAGEYRKITLARCEWLDANGQEAEAFDGDASLVETEGEITWTDADGDLELGRAYEFLARDDPITEPGEDDD